MNYPKNIESRLADIEAKQTLLIDIVCALAEKVTIDSGNFALHALACEFSAQDLAILHEFMGWAVKRDTAPQLRELRASAGHEPETSDESSRPLLTREEIIDEFEARLPQWKDSLTAIMRAFQADGQFPSLCRIILGSEPPIDSGYEK